MTVSLPQPFRFVLVGAFNTGFSYAVYALGLYAGLRFEVANLVACVAGIFVGFRTHGRFVFQGAQAPKLWKYFASWLGLYALNIGLIALFVRLGINTYAGGALAMPLVVATSYLLNRSFVFSGNVPAPPRG